jgi:hypothetical protein
MRALLNNRTFLFGGSICAIILLAEVAALVIGAIRLSAANEVLERKRTRLSELHHRNPYPSEANVRLLEDQLDELDFLVGELAAQMNRDPFPKDVVEAAEFSARAQDVIERFRKHASSADVVLPETLEVGFAQYASGGAVPEQEQVPRLTRQLYSVECVADVLVQCGVTSINTLSRDMFEEAGMEERTTRRRPRARGGPVAGVPEASITGPDRVFYIERVGVSFTTTENGVWDVLNAFAAAPHFMEVVEFSHQTRSNILAHNPAELKRGSESDDETLRFLSEGILSGKDAISRPERIIAGDDLVDIHISVNVFNFRPEEK